MLNLINKNVDNVVTRWMYPIYLSILPIKKKLYLEIIKIPTYRTSLSDMLSVQ